ncbi:RraA family protein [Alkalibaculum sp. M08DMB]|uniref:Putative 4-hydroxy-4-methyl-2-oxoglutarate aldolase n=1 Tax=Alkalibaculum sporogenes TaxID=2655001 RepID=A0A6A7KAA4_9FIRM|nr:RraA family protein [Alkalibaculum sporogenes]MPW26117.1 RraA family protein [Alkalibaculum sporogenes]
MSKVGCRIRTDFERPSRELIEKFKDIPVANLDDCMNRISAIDENIRPINNSKILGPAFTIKVPEGDNLMFHKAMDIAKPGDIIVIDAGGTTKRAIFGELMVNYCMIRGIGGIIVDGSLRDVDFISKLVDFPVYAKGITPNGPYKNGPGEINTDVVVGGQVVSPGDIVIGDGDGVLFIKPYEAEEILERVQKVQQIEAEIMDKIKNDKTYIRPWMDKKLEEIACDYI